MLAAARKDTWCHQNPNAVNETFWDAQNIEDEFSGSGKLPSRNLFFEVASWKKSTGRRDLDVTNQICSIKDVLLPYTRRQVRPRSSRHIHSNPTDVLYRSSTLPRPNSHLSKNIFFLISDFFHKKALPRALPFHPRCPSNI